MLGYSYVSLGYYLSELDSYTNKRAKDMKSTRSGPFLVVIAGKDTVLDQASLSKT